MEKLEMYQLAKYLPYQLKCQYEGILNSKELSEYDKKFNLIDFSFGIPEVPDRPEEIKGLKVGIIKSTHTYKNHSVVEIGIKTHGLKKFGLYKADFKPILRPLSDLIIERDGKVDLVELAKIECCNERNVLYPKFSSDHGLFIIYYASTDSDFTRYRLIYNSYINGFVIGDCECPTNQLDMFEYLFSKHYDVYGLIEKGLAIDINTK